MALEFDLRARVAHAVRKQRATAIMDRHFAGVGAALWHAERARWRSAPRRRVDSSSAGGDSGRTPLHEVLSSRLHYIDADDDEGALHKEWTLTDVEEDYRRAAAAVRSDDDGGEPPSVHVDAERTSFVWHADASCRTAGPMVPTQVPLSAEGSAASRSHKRCLGVLAMAADCRLAAAAAGNAVTSPGSSGAAGWQLVRLPFDCALSGLPMTVLRAGDAALLNVALQPLAAAPSDPTASAAASSACTGVAHSQHPPQQQRQQLVVQVVPAWSPATGAATSAPHAAAPSMRPHHDCGHCWSIPVEAWSQRQPATCAGAASAAASDTAGAALVPAVFAAPIPIASCAAAVSGDDGSAGCVDTTPFVVDAVAVPVVLPLSSGGHCSALLVHVLTSDRQLVVAMLTPNRQPSGYVDGAATGGSAATPSAPLLAPPSASLRVLGAAQLPPIAAAAAPTDADAVLVRDASLVDHLAVHAASGCAVVMSAPASVNVPPSIGASRASRSVHAPVVVTIVGRLMDAAAVAVQQPSDVDTAERDLAAALHVLHAATSIPLDGQSILHTSVTGGKSAAASSSPASLATPVICAVDIPPSVAAVELPETSLAADGMAAAVCSERARTGRGAAPVTVPGKMFVATGDGGVLVLRIADTLARALGPGSAGAAVASGGSAAPPGRPSAAIPPAVFNRCVLPSPANVARAASSAVPAGAAVPMLRASAHGCLWLWRAQRPEAAALSAASRVVDGEVHIEECAVYATDSEEDDCTDASDSDTDEEEAPLACIPPRSGPPGSRSCRGSSLPAALAGRRSFAPIASVDATSCFVFVGHVDATVTVWTWEGHLVRVLALRPPPVAAGAAAAATAAEADVASSRPTLLHVRCDVEGVVVVLSDGRVLAIVWREPEVPVHAVAP